MDSRLKFLPGSFTVHRLRPGSKLPGELFESDFWSVTQGPEELSVLCSDSLALHSDKQEPGWSCFRVVGVLEFSLLGVIARLSRCLAEAEISIFVVSSFDTDFVLVKQAQREQARRALEAAGWVWEE